MITPSFGLTATERVLPKLALDFTNASLDPRVTFTRTTSASNPATYVDSNGTITLATDNQPRFDYNPITLVCKGLLIEESRQNIVLYSQEFDNAYWFKNRSSITSVDAIEAPDGTVTADVLTEDTTASATHYLRRAFTSVSGTTYTWSVFLKNETRRYASLQLGDNGAAFNTNNTRVDLLNGVIVSTTAQTANITAFKNGWYRVDVTMTAIASLTTAYAYVYLDNGTTVTYTGDGTSGIYIWGAQLEAGAFPTSYIPTTTTSLTRNADVATMTGTNFSDWFNASEGALFAEASQPVIFATSKQTASLNDGTSTNRIMLYRQAAGSINGIVIPSGQVFLSSGVTAAANTTWKQMFAYTTVRGTYAANGVLGTDVLYPIPSSVLNTLTIGAGYPGSNDFLNGHIKKIMYYPIKLTNAEVVAFTKL